MKRRRAILNFVQIASLIMGLIVVGLFAAVTTMHFAIHGAEVKVPALKGMTVAEARSQTSGLGLNLEVDNRYYSAEVAAGHILTQSPVAGTVVRREWHVRVAESLGPQRVDVPDMVGNDQRVAALKLRRVGLEVGAVAQLADGKVAEGTVIAQDPPAHSQGIESPSINLLVAGPASETPDGFVMPSLIGQPIVAAQAALTKVGIKTIPPVFEDAQVQSIGIGNSIPKPPEMPGSVIAQQPVAGVRIDLSTQVKLTVAR